jgi:Ice-binding-like
VSAKLVFGRGALRGLLLSVPLLIASLFLTGGTAGATPTPVGLGTATTFAIRAGTIAISDAGGASVITGSVGMAPAGGATIGLLCSQVNAGAGPIYSTDGAGPPCPAAANNGLMLTVQGDAHASFVHVSGLPGATALMNPDLVSQNLVAGIYSFGAAATNLSGALTMNAQGDPNSVWIFKASSSLITSSASTMVFTNTGGATQAQLACNVFWTVGSSATLNSGSSFVGTILASADIFVRTGVIVNGRLLAANAAGGAGQVNLDHDTIIRPAGCPTLPAGTGGTITAAGPAAPVAAPPLFTG